MPADFVYDGSKIVVANGTSGTPKTFANMHDADLAGTLELLAAWSPDSNTKALGIQVQPADFKGLLVDFVVGDTKTADTDYIFITGTDIDGNAQTESLDVSVGDGTYTTTKWFATITNIDCSDNAAGSGVVWADGTVQVVQNRWGVIWEIAEDGQYKIDCNIDFGDEVTSTYFQSEKEQVFFTLNNTFSIKSNATLEFGDISGTTVRDGCCWSVDHTAGNWEVISIGQTGTWLCHASMFINRSVSNRRAEIKGGTWSVVESLWVGNANNIITVEGSASVTWSNFRVFGLRYIISSVAITADKVLCADFVIYGGIYWVPSDIDGTITHLEIKEPPAVDVAVLGVNATFNLIDPLQNVISPTISQVTGAVKEKYTCNIHVTDKDGADLQSVDIDCEYAHLVEGDDSKTYKCIQDHTAVDADHKPITGTYWADYWELYDDEVSPDPQIGGDWDTGFDYKAGTQEFAQDTTDANGDITEQVVQYKKWLGTSEVLEARIHKFTFSHGSYPDSVMSDIIVDHPLVWEFDMGQSTSDLTIIARNVVSALYTTLAVRTSDSVFTLAAGSTDNDAYNNMVLALYDVSGSLWQVREIRDYVGSSKTITVDTAFTFTVSTSDIIQLSLHSYSPTVAAGALTAQDVHEYDVRGITTQGLAGYEIQQKGGRYG